MPVVQNFELASRSVPNESYEARRKPWPLIEVLRYVACGSPYICHLCQVCGLTHQANELDDCQNKNKSSSWHFDGKERKDEHF